MRSQSKERRPAGNRNFNRCPATSFREQANLLRSLSDCDDHKPATAATHQFSIRARFPLFGCIQAGVLLCCLCPRGGETILVSTAKLCTIVPRHGIGNDFKLPVVQPGCCCEVGTLHRDIGGEPGTCSSAGSCRSSGPARLRNAPSCSVVA